MTQEEVESTWQPYGQKGELCVNKRALLKRKPEISKGRKGGVQNLEM
jgi:hypothetical protein